MLGKNKFQDLVTILQRPFFLLLRKSIRFSDIMQFTDSFISLRFLYRFFFFCDYQLIFMLYIDNSILPASAVQGLGWISYATRLFKTTHLLER